MRRALEQDKPVHLSLGYAVCHWCHVMAYVYRKQTGAAPPGDAAALVEHCLQATAG